MRFMSRRTSGSAFSFKLSAHEEAQKLLYKQMQHAHLGQRLRQMGQHFLRYQVATARTWLEAQGGLLYHVLPSHASSSSSWTGFLLITENAWCESRAGPEPAPLSHHITATAAAKVVESSKRPTLGGKKNRV